MPDIQFVDEEQQYQQPITMNKKPLFVRLVLSTGIVSTDRAAERVLLGMAAAAFILSLYFFFGGTSSNFKKQPPDIFDPLSVLNTIAPVT